MCSCPPIPIRLPLGPTNHYEPAVSGDYILTIRMEDIVGNVYLSSTAITVDNEGLDINYRGYTDITMGINFLYPWDWPTPTFYLDEEGGYEAIISNEEETINIYVIAYEGSSDQDAYDTQIGYLESLAVDDLTYDEEVYEDVTVYGYPGTLLSYYFTIDGESHLGAVLSVYVPDLATSFVIDLDTTEALADEGDAVLNTMLGSMIFFIPPETE